MAPTKRNLAGHGEIPYACIDGYAISLWPGKTFEDACYASGIGFSQRGRAGPNWQSRGRAQ